MLSKQLNFHAAPFSWRSNPIDPRFGTFSLYQKKELCENQKNSHKGGSGGSRNMVIFPNIPKRSRQQTSSLLLESVLGGVSSPSEARWHPPDNDWRCSGDLASSRQQVGQHQASLQCDRLPPTSSSLQLRLVKNKRHHKKNTAVSPFAEIFNFLIGKGT